MQPPSPRTRQKILRRMIGFQTHRSRSANAMYRPALNSLLRFIVKYIQVSINYNILLQYRVLLSIYVGTRITSCYYSVHKVKPKMKIAV